MTGILSLLLRRYWLHAVVALLAAVLTWQAASWYWGAKIVRLNSAHDQEILAQREELLASFNDQAQKTEEINHANQDKIAALDARLAAAQRLHADTCVPIVMHEPAPAPGGDIKKTPGNLHGPDGGVTADALLELAHDADAAVIDQNTCVETLDAIYAQARKGLH